MIQILFFILRTIIVFGIIYFSFSLDEIGILFFPDRYFTILIGFFGLFFYLGLSSRRSIYIWIISLHCLARGGFLLAGKITTFPFFTPILLGKNIEVIKDGYCYKSSACFPTLNEAYCNYDFFHQDSSKVVDEFVPIPDSDCIFTGSATQMDYDILKISKGDTLLVNMVFIGVEDFGNYTELQFNNTLPYRYNSEYFHLNVPVFNSFIGFLNPHY